MELTYEEICTLLGEMMIQLRQARKDITFQVNKQVASIKEENANLKARVAELEAELSKYPND